MTDLVMARRDVMSPGSYIERRRHAAGLTIEDVALMLGHDTAEAAELVDQLAELEDDAVALGGEAFLLVDRLRGAFPFDPTIFAALVGVATDDNPARPVPQICRVCGCSWNDACVHAASGYVCSWAEDDLCTACQSVIAEIRR